jgi:hypothetical protein
MVFTKRGLILCLGIAGFLLGGGLGIAVSTLRYWSSFSISVVARGAVIGAMAFGVAGAFSGWALFRYITERPVSRNESPT